MTARTTYSGSSTPPVPGVTFLNEYAARIKDLYDSSCIYLTGVAGTANAVTATLDPVLDGGGLVDGMKFSLLWGATNSGGVTLALNGGTALPVVDSQGAALMAGAVVSNLLSMVEYLSGSFRVLTPLLAGSSVAITPRYYLKATATQTWNKPTGYDDDAILWVELWGGGGSGRSTAAANDNGGGGGGGYIRAGFRLGNLPSSLTLTIGAGGVSALNAAGNSGGNTSFGTLLTALGGAGGVGSGGGQGGTTSIGANDLHQPFSEDGGRGATDGLAAPGVDIAGAGGGEGFTGASDGGVSKFGGDGGSGGDNAPTPTAGIAPGGGGGGADGAAVNSGAGARGEARLYI